MFNHSSSSTVHYKYSSDSSSIHILSGSSPIKSGTEVNLNYGAVPNSKLLLFYGFSLQDNEEDFVDIYVPLQEGVDGREEKVKLLQGEKTDEEKLWGAYLSLSFSSSNHPTNATQRHSPISYRTLLSLLNLAAACRPPFCHCSGCCPSPPPPCPLT